ncbi:MAG: hypothetical protein HOP91_08265 [Sphingomonas sp.]|nr:hypothetical protein [Sphingomonas sp.]
MPSDNESSLLPEPPPPRPAARDAAIEAAMRRFDGLPDQPAAKPKPRVAWSRRPQFQLAMAASLVLAVGLPATLIAIHDNGGIPGTTPRPAAEAPAQVESVAPSMNFAPEAPSDEMKVPAKPAPPATIPAPQLQAPAVNAPAPAAPVAQREVSAERDEIAPAPPPPPPPPPPSVSQKSAVEEGSALVVTGSRVQSDLADSSALNSLPRKTEAPSRTYARFLGDLQSAVRNDDREALIKLIRFPLRVNAGGKSRIYRDAQAVRVDYDRVFTRRVTEAILAQRADKLFSRDEGVMIGNGQVWFDRACVNQDCSSLGPVRITAINP